MSGSLSHRAHEARRSHSLYFSALLPEQTIREAFDAARATLGGWIYTPATVVWCFLSQVLSADHGCRETVARLNAFRVSQGRPSCSPKTGGYCIARDKIPEDVCQHLLEQTGRNVSESSQTSGLWHGRRTRVVDGATITMPDTPENQDAYPQPKTQDAGCGFPMMRFVVLFCLHTGAALRMACGPYAGKQTGECSLFRSISDELEPGDVLVADQYFSGWFDIMLLVQRGIDVAIRKYHSRRTDFRTGVRLGKDDHLIEWPKPPRPEWMDRETYRQLPSKLVLREFRKRVDVPGFRTRTILVVTTLQDAKKYSRDDIAQLYYRRWQAELHLRSLKTVMQMDHLRCLKPHRVRNELRMHLIAYNLLRGVMCEAAAAAGRPPYQVSFKGTLQSVNEFLPMLVAVDDIAHWCATLLHSVAAHHVGHRPGRSEPRVRKKRPKSYPPLTQPRHKYKTSRPR